VKLTWHSYNGGQTVGWMKMPLGTQVGLGPGDFVLVGTQHSPQFSAHVYCGYGRPSQLMLSSEFL